MKTPLSRLLKNGRRLVMEAGNLSNTILPLNITQPIIASTNAVPDRESLWISMPLITIVGVAIIVFILFVTFKEQINAFVQIIVNYISDLIKGVPSMQHPSKPAPNDEKDTLASPASNDDNDDIIDKMMPGMRQVFNIAENKYKYADAEPLCKALGAELATYDDVLSAWKSGADWCNYGWVKGQTAVYPTQASSYDKMQKMGTAEQRSSCGTVGLNGGHFDNPDLKFGVNCIGTKPIESQCNNAATSPSLEPLTKEQIEHNRKVAHYKSTTDCLKLNPFRENAWSG